MFELLSEIISALRIRERIRGLPAHYRIAISALLLFLLVVVGYRDTIVDFFKYAGVSAEVASYGSRIPRLSKVDGLYRDFLAEISPRMRIYYVDSVTNNRDNAWNAAQAFSGLGSPSGDLSARVEGYFQKVMVSDCTCWKDQGVPSVPATAWVVMAASRFNGAMGDSGVRGLLAAQAADGAWPDLVGAVQSPKYDSLYATAIAVRALHAWTKQRHKSGLLAQNVRLALDRATTWLIESNNTNSVLWMDYPHHPSRFGSAALTADTLAELIADGQYEAVAPHIAAFLDYVSGRTYSMRDIESSDSDVELQNGGSVQDRTIYTTFASIVRFLSIGYSHFSVRQRIRALRWIDANVLNEANSLEVPSKEWALAETLLSLQDLRTASSADR